MESVVPDGIIPTHQGGDLIQEGADNIDINTETVDGKNTFHGVSTSLETENMHSVIPITFCSLSFRIL
jgi:hypothetical protein